jgi:hypothetical protein
MKRRLRIFSALCDLRVSAVQILRLEIEERDEPQRRRDAETQRRRDAETQRRRGRREEEIFWSGLEGRLARRRVLRIQKSLYCSL